MALTQKQKEKFYKNREKVKKVILQNAKRRGHTIYGARALNAHFPAWLDRPTEDWDIYSKTPKLTANRIEKKLDKKFGADIFFVKRATHKETWKVQNRVTKTNTADYTKPSNKIGSKRIDGINYESLEHRKKSINKVLKDKEAKFRHDKEREALQRINIFEVQRRRPKTRLSKFNVIEGVL